MDTENTTHDSGTAAPSTEQNSPYGSLGSLEFAVLILFMTSFMNPTWGSSSSFISETETKRKLEKIAHTVASTQRNLADVRHIATSAQKTATSSLTLGIIGTATAAAALAASILTACLL